MKTIQLLAFLLLLPITTHAADPVPYPALTPNAVILFHGDSITDGGWLRNSSDLNHIMGQSYAYLIAAQLGLELADRNLTFINRGVGGSGIKAIGTADAIKFKPAIISIATGTNDCQYLDKGPDHGMPATDYEATYDQLLARFQAALPDTRFILVAPFTLCEQGSERDLARRPVLKAYQEAVDRLGAKYHCPVVHLQPAFDEALKIAPARHWSWDGVHPTYAGHAIIQREWLKALATIPASATTVPASK